MLKIKTFLKKISFFMLTAPALSSYAQNNPTAQTKQLVIVTSENWDATTGILCRFERSTIENQWQRVGEEIAVTLGRKGMGWGIGLHGEPLTEGPIVTEGSGRSPAGAFEIPLAFGKDEATSWSVKLPYTKISSTVFCPDDLKSKYYNSIVDIEAESMEKDWDSAEDMQGYVDQGLYVYGAMIGHNYSPAISGRGSCFFIHIWRGPERPTAGCTAMAIDNAKEVVSWLDPQKNPVLVQFPKKPYDSLKDQWGLPNLPLILSASVITQNITSETPLIQLKLPPTIQIFPTFEKGL